MSIKHRSAIVLLLAGWMLGAIGGCQFIPWSVAQFSPPRKVRAKFKPARRKTFLVLVDDAGVGSSHEPVKAELTELLNEQLKEHKVARRAVPYERVMELAYTATNYEGLAVDEVGKKLGADIVLYVIIDNFSLRESKANPLWGGNLEVTVRLVDVEKGRLWPLDRLTGYPVPAVKLPLTTGDSPAYGSQLTRKLTQRMADRVAKLFYTHRVSRTETYKPEVTGL